MKLFYRKFGDATSKLIIIHGLYGASDNWIPIGKELAKYHEVYILDVRNHGKSPHNIEHNYNSMSADIIEFMNEHCIEKTHIIGHSMGGKIAMYTAAKHPNKIESLISIDIAPKNYSQNKNLAQHKIILKTMLNVNLKDLTQRADLKKQLAFNINSDYNFHFFAKNIKLNKNKKFEWKLNVPVLYNEIKSVADGFSVEDKINQNIKIPALFIKAELSNYITEPDYKLIREMFPLAKIQTIHNTNHWVHMQQAHVLTESLIAFYKNNKTKLH